jgi:hypothetical protein
MKMGHEVTLVEGDRDRYALLEEKFEHVVRRATPPSCSC